MSVRRSGKRVKVQARMRRSKNSRSTFAGYGWTAPMVMNIPGKVTAANAAARNTASQERRTTCASEEVKNAMPIAAPIPSQRYCPPVKESDDGGQLNRRHPVGESQWLLLRARSHKRRISAGQALRESDEGSLDAKGRPIMAPGAAAPCSPSHFRSSWRARKTTCRAGSKRNLRAECRCRLQAAAGTWGSAAETLRVPSSCGRVHFSLRQPTSAFHD